MTPDRRSSERRASAPASRIAQPTPANYERAVARLAAGELVGLPTETVYGLAANAFDSDAVARIFAAKGRPSTNPLIVHIPSAEALNSVASLPASGPVAEQISRLIELWPGPLTLVCPRSQRVPDAVTAGRETVAVRVPDHPVALELLRRCPFPLAAPSANRSNYISPTRPEHVASGFGDAVSMILDGGACRRGLESTIVAPGDRTVRLLRPGAMTLETLQRKLGDIPIETVLVQNSSADAAEAPGMMRRHYSPNTPLQIVPDGTPPPLPPEQLSRMGRIVFAPLSEEDSKAYAAVAVLSERGSLEEAAHNLFAAMREMDRSGVTLILADACEEAGIGQAIMDRLRRAAARRGGSP